MKQLAAPRRSPRALLAASAATALCAVTLLGAAPPPPPSPAADAEAGREVFRACSACHTVDPGGPSTVGPNLFGVLGRDIAGVEGFAYSDALRAVEGSWNARNLDRLIANPAELAPGTRMVVRIPDARQRADLIAYLATLREGVAAPAQPPPDFGADWPAGPGQVETGRLCSSCHSLAIVKQQRLSRSTWDDLLDWMIEEQGMAAQPPERRALILDYLVAHFGAPK